MGIENGKQLYSASKTGLEILFSENIFRIIFDVNTVKTA